MNVNHCSKSISFSSSHEWLLFEVSPNLHNDEIVLKTIKICYVFYHKWISFVVAHQRAKLTILIKISYIWNGNFIIFTWIYRCTCGIFKIWVTDHFKWGLKGGKFSLDWKKIQKVDLIRVHKKPFQFPIFERFGISTIYLSRKEFINIHKFQ